MLKSKVSLTNFWKLGSYPGFPQPTTYNRYITHHMKNENVNEVVDTHISNVAINRFDRRLLLTLAECPSAIQIDPDSTSQVHYQRLVELAKFLEAEGLCDWFTGPVLEAAANHDFTLSEAWNEGVRGDDLQSRMLDARRKTMQVLRGLDLSNLKILKSALRGLDVAYTTVEYTPKVEVINRPSPTENDDVEISVKSGDTQSFVTLTTEI